RVDAGLAGGVGVDGGHDGFLYATPPPQTLLHRCDAVCRAARARDDGRAPLRRVDSVDDGFHIVAVRGCRQDDVPSSGADVRIEVLTLGERARALEHDVHFQ